jgi:hypothetical protein
MTTAAWRKRNPDRVRSYEAARKQRRAQQPKVERVTPAAFLAGREKVWQRLRGQTHCKHGHEFTPANTTIRANGTRLCKTCHRIHEANRRARIAKARAA